MILLYEETIKLAESEESSLHYCIILAFYHPAYSLTVLPFTFSLYLILKFLTKSPSPSPFSISMLFSIFPLSLVFSSIWPFKYSVAIFFVCFILAFVFSSINPSEYPSSLHLIILPGSHIPPTVAPMVISLQEIIIGELALIV